MEYSHIFFAFEENNLDEGFYPFGLFDHQLEDNFLQNDNNLIPINTVKTKPFNILHNVLRTPKEKTCIPPLSAKSKLIQKREKAKQRQFLKTLNSKQDQLVIQYNDQEIKSQISTTENSSEKVEKTVGCTKLSDYQLKLYKKQIRNRISAQKSREKQKFEFQKLMRQNKLLQCKLNKYKLVEERNTILEEENEKLKDQVLQYEEKFIKISSEQLCQENNLEINCNYSQNLRFPRAGQASPKKNFFMTSLVLITILSCCTIFQLDQNSLSKNKFYTALIQTKQYFTIDNNSSQQQILDTKITNKSTDFTILYTDQMFKTIPNEYSQITNFCFGKNFYLQEERINDKVNGTNFKNNASNCSFIL